MGAERMAHPIIGAAQSVVRVSVIVPTLNELENVDPLVRAILAQAENAGPSILSTAFVRSAFDPKRTCVVAKFR